MRYIGLILIFWCVGWGSVVGQTIPKAPNKVDEQGRR